MSKACYKINHGNFYPELDCPCCEIDRFKSELEEAKDEAFKREARIMMYVQQVCDLELQLAEARVGVEG